MQQKQHVEIISAAGLNTTKTRMWYIKYQRHQLKTNSKHSIPDMTFQDYINKAKAAGLTDPVQIGRRSNQFCLRHESTTEGYTVANCQFIKNEDKIVIKPGTPFVLIDPQGNTHHGHNLNAFCKQNALHQSGMNKVVNGKIPHYKGWTGYYQAIPSKGD